MIEAMQIQSKIDQYPAKVFHYCGKVCERRISRSVKNPDRCFYSCNFCQNITGRRETFAWCDSDSKYFSETGTPAAPPQNIKKRSYPPSSNNNAPSYNNNGYKIQKTQQPTPIQYNNPSHVDAEILDNQFTELKRMMNENHQKLKETLLQYIKEHGDQINENINKRLFCIEDKIEIICNEVIIDEPSQTTLSLSRSQKNSKKNKK